MGSLKNEAMARALLFVSKGSKDRMSVKSSLRKIYLRPTCEDELGVNHARRWVGWRRTV